MGERDLVRITDVEVTAEPTTEPLKRLSEMVDMPPHERMRHQLRILDGLMAAAVRDKDYIAALRITESARNILKAR